jgi:hypothetical protein
MPPARRTTRLAEIVRLFGHSAGGRPSERLLARLGMPVSDTTILRSLKKGVAVPPDRAVVRVVGVDEWAKLAKVPLAAGQWNASGGVAEGHEFRDGHQCNRFFAHRRGFQRRSFRAETYAPRRQAKSAVRYHA